MVHFRSNNLHRLTNVLTSSLEWLLVESDCSEFDLMVSETLFFEALAMRAVDFNSAGTKPGIFDLQMCTSSYNYSCQNLSLNQTGWTKWCHAFTCLKMTINIIGLIRSFHHGESLQNTTLQPQCARNNLMNFETNLARRQHKYCMIMTNGIKYIDWKLFVFLSGNLVRCLQKIQIPSI